MIEINRRLRGHRFYLTKAELAKVPRIYAQDGKGMDAIVHVHYFSRNADWWITEMDRTPDNGFGYVRFADYPQGAELGYIDLTELETIHQGLTWVERDLYWTPKPLHEAAGICYRQHHHCPRHRRCPGAPPVE